MVNPRCRLRYVQPTCLYQVSDCSLSNLLSFSFTVEQQKTDSQHFPSRPFTHRRHGPPTMGPPKNHVSSPLSNQLATIHSLFNSTQTQTLLQSHSQGTSGTTTSGSGGNSSSAARSSISDMSARNNVIHGNKGNASDSKLSFFREKNWNKTMCVALFSRCLTSCSLFSDSMSLLESDDYLEQDGYLEEEEVISGEDVLSDTINSNRQQLKRRRILRAPRERQRGEGAQLCFSVIAIR